MSEQFVEKSSNKSVKLKNNKKNKPKNNKNKVPAQDFKDRIESWKQRKIIDDRDGIEENVRKFATNSDFRGRFTTFAKSNAVKQKTVDHIIAQKVVANSLRMAQRDGYEVPANEKQALKIMLAADDFHIGEFMSNIGQKAMKLGQRYVLPALKTAFPMYGDIAETLITNIMSNDNDPQSIRVQKTIILTNFQLASDALQNINLNPGYDIFGWISQIARAYQYYHVHSLRIDFKTGAALNNSGMLKYYINYDMDLQAIALSDLDSQSSLQLSPVFQNHSHTWTDKDLHQRYPKYRVRSARLETETSDSAQQYDMGRLIIGHNSTTYSIGLVELTMDVEFFQPIVDPTIMANTVHAYSNTNAGSVCPTQFYSLFTSTASTVSQGGEISRFFRVLKSGYYTFFLVCTGTNALVITPPSVLTSYNTTDFVNNVFNQLKYYSTSGAQFGLYQVNVKLNAGQFFTLVRNSSEWFNQSAVCNVYEGWYNVGLVSGSNTITQGLVKPSIEDLSQDNQVQQILKRLQQLEIRQIPYNPKEQTEKPRGESLEERFRDIKNRAKQLNEHDDEQFSDLSRDFQALKRA